MKYNVLNYHFLFLFALCHSLHAAQNGTIPVKKAEGGEVPYHLLLEVRIEGEWYYNGSAVLLSEYEALTSAQQVYANLETMEKRPKESLRVIGGATNLHNKSRLQIKRISNIVVHPTFGKFMQYLRFMTKVMKFWTDDVAILTFTSEMRFNSLVQPVKLNFDQEAVIYGYECVRSGWTVGVAGNSDPALQTKQNLMKEIVDLRSNHEKHYFTMNHTELYRKTYRVMMADRQKKECIQELGGPLVCEVWDQKLLIGITLNYVEEHVCTYSAFNYFSNLAPLVTFFKNNLIEFQAYRISVGNSHITSTLPFILITATLNF